jgi:hypothetical protein
MLPVIAKQQNNKCADPLKTCEIVADGKATSRCPWQGRDVPEDMQQLDHIVPYSLTQDDRKENLQMLCSCCHSAKSAAEKKEILHKKNETVPMVQTPEEVLDETHLCEEVLENEYCLDGVDDLLKII